MSFVGKDPHRTTMELLHGYMAKTAFTRWKIAGSEVPLSWDEAIQRSGAATSG